MKKTSKTKRTVKDIENILVEALAENIHEMARVNRIRIFKQVVLSLATILNLVVAVILYLNNQYDQAIFFMLMSIFGIIVTRTER